MSLVPKLVQVTVPEGVSPGDTINVEAEGQTVQCQVPEGLKPGDTFQVQTATQPVVPPHAVREGQVVHGSITDEERSTDAIARETSAETSAEKRPAR